MLLTSEYSISHLGQVVKSRWCRVRITPGIGTGVRGLQARAILAQWQSCGNLHHPIQLPFLDHLLGLEATVSIVAFDLFLIVRAVVRDVGDVTLGSVPTVLVLIRGMVAGALVHLCISVDCVCIVECVDSISSIPPIVKDYYAIKFLDKRDVGMVKG